MQQLRIQRSLKTPLRSLPVYIMPGPISLSCIFSGVDPGFSIGGGANPPRRGRQPMILPNFPKNCMKLRKFWTVGGDAGSAPHRSATDSYALKSPFILFKANISITFAVRFLFIRCENTFIRITWVMIYISGCTSHVSGMYSSLVRRERWICVTCVTSPVLSPRGGKMNVFCEKQCN